MKKTFWALIFFIVIFSVEAQVTATLSTAASRFYAGESFLLTLNVQGVENIDAIPDLVLPGFRVEPKGGHSNSRSSIVIINGKKEQERDLSYLYTWNLTAEKAGIYTISPLELTLGSDTVVTNSLSLEIVMAQPHQDGNELVISIDKSLVYPGDSVLVTTELLFESKIAELSFDTNLFDTFYGEVEAVNPGSKSDVYSLPFGSTELPGTLGAVRKKGVQLSVLTIQMLLTPETSGFLDNLWISASFQEARGRVATKDFFGRTVYQDKYEPVFLRSEIPDMGVKSLPSRSDSKGGQLLGPLDISVEVDKTEVNTGEPVHLKLVYTGKGLERKQLLPDLREFPEWGDAFTFASEPPEITESGEALVWSSVIRPAHENSKGIPSFDIPVFNIEKEVWESVQTEPVEMDITFIPSIGSSQLQSFDNSAPVIIPGSTVLPEESTTLAARLFPVDKRLKKELFLPGLKEYALALFSVLLLNLGYSVFRIYLQNRKAGRNPEREAWQYCLDSIDRKNPSPESLFELFNLLERDKKTDSSVKIFRDELSEYLFNNSDNKKGTHSFSWPEKSKKRKLLPFLLLFMVSCSLPFVSIDAETGVSLKKAETFFIQALKEESSDTKNQLFEQALFHYSKLKSIPDASVQAGLGVLYARLDNPGLAALHLGQASRLSPSSYWIREYLSAVSPDEEHSFIKDDLPCLSFLSVSQISLTAYLSFLVILISLSFRFRRRGPSGVIIGACFLVFVWSGSVLLYDRIRPQGVLTVSVTARQGDGEFYEPGFQNDLPAGTQVRSVIELKGWRVIILNSGKRVWVPSDSFTAYRW